MHCSRTVAVFSLLVFCGEGIARDTTVKLVLKLALDTKGRN